MSKSLSLASLVSLALVVGGCSGGEVTGQTTASTTPPPSTTHSQSSTTTEPDSVTTTTAAGDGLDLSNGRWVTHGPDGIRLDDGTLIWETQAFPAGIARDRQGGLVFTDSTGLWWFQAGAVEPGRVGEDAYEVISVATAPEGPVALIWGGGPSFRSLKDGSTVEPPPSPPVEISSEPPWVTWKAANGLSAWVTGPEVERDSEDQPSKVLEPAHLIIARNEQVLVDVKIGGVYEAWATIHDFDGRTLIVSRGPYEPAMPSETFLVIDLAKGGVTGSFIAGGTKATLTQADVEWDGPVITPDLGSYSASSIATDNGVTSLQDGRYLVFIAGTTGDSLALELDLAVWFSGNEANIAARIDGETDIPVPNDYHIRNTDPATISMPVDTEVEVTSVWYDYETDPDLENDPITYQQFLDVIQGREENVQSHLRTSPWWTTVEGGTIVALDEQYVP